MKRFLSMLALAVLVLQSVVTSLAYATDQANPSEESDSVPAVETAVVDEVSDEGGNEGVTADLTDTELPVVEEPTTNVVEPDAPIIEEPINVEEGLKIDFEEGPVLEPLQFGLNSTPRLFAASEPGQSDFDKFIEDWNRAENESCAATNNQAGCVNNPKQYSLGLEGVEPGSGLDEGQVGMWKLVQPTDNPGEYEISIAVKGQPKREENNQEICAVVVFDKSYSMGKKMEGESCPEDAIDCKCNWKKCSWYEKGDKWNKAVQGAISFSDSLNSLVPTAKIGLVTFAQTASIPVHLKTGSLAERDFGNLEASTNTHAGLKLAKKELDDNCSAGAQKNIC